jgi:5-methylcytosine-specific restriction endonuclease McrA
VPWVLYDDQYPIRREVAGLSDAAFRLNTAAVLWCARNGTGDFVPEEGIGQVCAQVRKPARFAAECVERGSWLAVPGGWRIPQNDGLRDFWSIERDDYRRKIPAAVRDLVYERDGYQCVECGAAEDLTLDHIYPWSLGGSDAAENLCTLCRSCNSSKGARI